MRRATGFLFLLVAVLGPAGAHPPVQHVRVAIVGAGLSGMAAAHALLGRGITPEVYEARDRVGGRTYTLPGPTGPVDVGGSFINSTDTVLRALVRALGLKEIRVPSRDDTKVIVRGADGRPSVLDPATLYARFSRVLDRIHAEQARLGVRHFRLVGTSGRARYWDTRSVQDALEQLEAPAGFADYVAAYFGANFGRKLYDLDALHLFAGMEIDPVKRTVAFFDDEVADGALAVDGGNQAICREIARRLPVHTNHVLTRLESRGERIRLTFRTPNGARIIEASDAIVTVPFSVLKQRVEIRVPGYDGARRRYVETEIQGQCAKLILCFSSPVWRRCGHSGSLETTEFMTWPNGTDRPGGPGSLTAYIYVAGPGFRAGEMRDRVLETLEHYFPGIAKECEGYQLVDWPREAFTAGSFSRAKAPGQWFAGWPTVAQMRVGHLLFAGAHLAGDLTLAGYMNGAVFTGQEAARLVSDPPTSSSR
jgi:monoamine oxidase